MDREKPHSIDLRPFLCTHELLTYDFNYREERKPFEFLYESEWDALMTYYRSKRKKEIIMKRNQKGRFETEPAVCRPCRTARRADFDEVTIRLQFLIQEDINEVTGLPKTASRLSQHA